MRNPRFCNSGTRENRRSILTLSMIPLFLGGCFLNPEPPGGPLSAEVEGTSAVRTLQRVNERALRCWIRSGDREFNDLALVPELDTRTNDPRLLLVDKDDTRGLPKLVISASNGDTVKVTTFGPLTSQRISNRINGDVLAWSAGRSGCS